MRQLNTEIRQPQSCNDFDIAAFCSLVRQGGEVEVDGLEERVRTARALAFLYIDRALAGIAALKQPNRRHRDGVFIAAGLANAADFAFELGWVFVPPEHRGRGYSWIVSAAALSQADGISTFATTRLDNVPMQKTLSRLSFNRAGDAWASSRGEYQLVLYVTSPSQRLSTGVPG